MQRHAPGRGLVGGQCVVTVGLFNCRKSKGEACRVARLKRLAELLMKGGQPCRWSERGGCDWGRDRGGLGWIKDVAVRGLEI